MPTFVDGLSSGIKTNEIIEKLKEVEKRPLKNLDQKKQELLLEIEVFTQLINLANSLEQKVKVLYGYESNFTSKVLVTEPDGFITGEVSKKAKTGEYQIKINNLATKLLISSRNIKLDEQIPSGTISINDQTASFTGGTLSNFQSFLNTNFSTLLTSKIIKNTSNTHIIAIESNKEGESGLLEFKDPNNLLSNLELYNPNPQTNNTNSENNKKPDPKKKQKPKNTTESLLFDSTNTINPDPSLATISPEQKKIQLKPEGSITLNTTIPEKENAIPKLFTIQVRGGSAIEPIENEEEDTAPEDLEYGETKNLNIKGIELFTYNSLRHRDKEEPEEKEPEEFDYGIIINKNGETETISLKDKNTGNIPITSDLTSIEFYSKNANVSFSNPKLIYENNEPTEENNDENDDEKTNKNNTLPTNNLDPNDKQSVYPHLLKHADNAKLNVDGIDIDKNSNKEINDVIDGVNLNLLKPSDVPITLKIKNDSEKPVKQITEFIEAYNTLLKFSKENTTASKVLKKPGEYDNLSKLKGETGALIGDSSVRSLINGLRTKVSNAYTSYREPQIKVLSSIGITTGEIGAKWEEISDGYLVLNQAKLQEALNNYPEAVKEFFASDKNGDLRIDDGFAYQMQNFINAYAQNYGNGIFYNKIQTRKEQIEELKKSTTKVEEKVTKFEERLRQKFGAMESAISKQKSMGSQLKMKLGGNQQE